MAPGPRMVSPRAAHHGALFGLAGGRQARARPRVALPVRRQPLFARPTLTLEWVEARRHPTREPVLIPVEFVAPRFADLGPGFDRAAALAVPITNGLGAGLTHSHALAHGVSELLQRDGNSVHYRALDRGLLVDLGEGYEQVRDPRTRSLLQTLDAAGIEILVKLADDSFGLTNLYVVGYDRDPAQGSPGDQPERVRRGGASRPRTRAGQSPARIRLRPRPEGVQPRAARTGPGGRSAGLPGGVWPGVSPQRGRPRPDRNATLDAAGPRRLFRGNPPSAFRRACPPALRRTADQPCPIPARCSPC